MVFRPAGRLRLRVPALVETDSIASVVLLDAAGRPLLGRRAETSWQVTAGNSVIDGVPAGPWNVRVAAPDGQQWLGEVTTSGGGETAVELQ